MPGPDGVPSGGLKPAEEVPGFGKVGAGFRTEVAFVDVIAGDPVDRAKGVEFVVAHRSVSFRVVVGWGAARAGVVA